MSKYFFKAWINVFLILILAANGSVYGRQGKSVIICGNVRHASDSMQLLLYKSAMYRFLADAEQSSVISDSDGLFKFKFNIPDKPCYIFLNFYFTPSRILPDPRDRIHPYASLPYYIVEPGDSIYIDVADGLMSFSGDGVEKFELRYQLDHMSTRIKSSEEYLAEQAEINKGHFNDFYKEAVLSQRRSDSILESRLKVLEKYRTKISPFLFQSLKTDFVGDQMEKTFDGLDISYAFATDTSIIYEIIRYYRDNLLTLPVDTSHSRALSESYTYCNFLLCKAKLDVMMSRSGKGVIKNTFTFGELYDFIYNKYSGFLREKLLTMCFMRYFSHRKDASDYLANAISLIQTPYFRKILNQLKDALYTGMPAYPFSLQDTSGKEVTLAGLKGRVVLMDFWFTGCTGCSSLAAVLPEVTKEFNGHPEVVFISVCVDKNMDMWKNSVRKGIYTSPEETNLYTNGAGFDHPIFRHYQYTGCPDLLLIDAFGNIFLANPSRPDIEGPERLIAEIKQAVTQSIR